jgi:MYXO-CTERM domain-containing protein
MRAVCPPDTETFEWSFYCANVITAWGGGVLDTSRGRLLLWGGGHGDYWGNEVYAFDLQSLQWERIWGPSADADIPGGDAIEVYGDGNPGSRHTYSGLSYVPPPVDAMFTMGGALWQTGSFSSATWRFDVANGSWSRVAEGPAEQGFGDPSVFDAQTGHVFRRTNSRMVEYDPVADTFTDRAESDGGWWAPNVAATLDPNRRLMIIIGDGRLDSYDLASDTYVQDVAIAGADVTSLFGDGSPGIDYDPVTEQIVVWSGGRDVYTYDPDAAAFSQHAGEGDDPGTISASGGAFGRFRYAPSRNVFVWVDNADANVFVFRMGEGTGVPPSGDESSSGGADSDSGNGEASGGSGSESAGSTGSAATTSGESGGSASGGSTSGGEGSGANGDDAASGCGCRSEQQAPALAWIFPLLALGLRARAHDRTATARSSAGR